MNGSKFDYEYPKMVSLTPPEPGWYAKYEDEKGEYYWPIISWALVEDFTVKLAGAPSKLFRYVEGVTAGGNEEIDLATEASNFIGYVRRREGSIPGEPEEWEQPVKVVLKREGN